MIGVYHGLVGLCQRVSQALADIDVRLTQRRELTPNLVKAVPGNAKHKRETLASVIKARNTAMTTHEGPGAQPAAEGRYLTSAHLEHSESISRLSVFRFIVTTVGCHMGRRTEAADRTRKDTQRQTRKRYSSEDQIRIVLAGL